MRLARVHSAQTLPEAAVVISLVAAHDITACPVGLHTASNCWHMLVALGGIPILVVADDTGDAIALLTHHVAKPELFESRAFRQQPLLNGLGTLLLVFGLGIYCPFWMRRNKISDWP